MSRTHTGKARTEENYLRMEEIRNRLKMSKSDFSIALGYVTGGGYDASTRSGTANLMQLLAAEGVETRYGGKVQMGSRPICYTLLAIQMGRDYLLIPKPTQANR